MDLKLEVLTSSFPGGLALGPNKERDPRRSEKLLHQWRPTNHRIYDGNHDCPRKSLKLQINGWLVVSTHLNNIIQSNWKSSPNRDENEKSLKPPPSDGVYLKNHTTLGQTSYYQDGESLRVKFKKRSSSGLLTTTWRFTWMVHLNGRR